MSPATVKSAPVTKVTINTVFLSLILTFNVIIRIVLFLRVNTVIPPRGIAPLIVGKNLFQKNSTYFIHPATKVLKKPDLIISDFPCFAGLNKIDIRLEYGQEPESEMLLCNSDLGHPDLVSPNPSEVGGGGAPASGGGGAGGTGGSRDWVFVEGDVLGGRRLLVDCVRQMYLGRHPPALKMCTRCAGVTCPNPHTDTRNKLQGWENRWLSHCPCGGLWKVASYHE